MSTDSDHADAPDPQPDNIFVDGSGRLRLGVRVFVVTLAVLILDTVVQLVVGFVALIGILVTQLESNESATSEEIEQTATDWLPELVSMSAVPRLLCALTLLVVATKWLDRERVSALGFRRPSGGWFACVGLGLGLGFFPIAMVAGLLLVIGSLIYDGMSIGWPRFIHLVPGLLLAALFEELLFRGYALRNFVKSDRPWTGMIVTSVAFWLVHSLNPSAWQSPLVALNLILAGVFLSLTYLIANNIWFPTIVHFAWNFSQGPLFGIPVSGIHTGGLLQLSPKNDSPTWLNGGDFGFEASILSVVVASTVCIGLGFYWRRHRASVVCDVAAEPQIEERQP